MRQSVGCCFFAAAAAALLLSYSADASYSSSCYGSLGGSGGHIYQFDGGVLSLRPRLCDVLLVKSRSGVCDFQIRAQYASTKAKGISKKLKGISVLKRISVIVNGRRFNLLSGRRFSVNGKLRNVPYSEKYVRTFMSGDDIVLVHKKCKLWVTFNGELTATFRLSKAWRRRVEGLAGNCDGYKSNDARGDPRKQLKKWVKKNWISNKCQLSKSRISKYLGCHSRKEFSAARYRCARVIRKSKHCSKTKVLLPCIMDFCATRYLPHLQRSVLCENFYLQSRRCAAHHGPINWRVRAGCPAKCGKNEHFSRKISPCQKTCESHFFGSPKSCFKLKRSEGCRCNRGFVLDGANCVRPRDCVCLAKLCIDRQPHSKCKYWRSLGRCKEFPKFMSDNCRLTCGLCTPHCKNQISSKLCKSYKRKGKCSDSFYRAMCQATCNPSGCGCPPPTSSTSPCSPKYKNRLSVSKKWLADESGKCKLSVLMRYSTCALCRRISTIRRGRCNFCKRVRYDTKIVQYREKYGKKRCIRRVKRLRRSCTCARRATSFMRCERNRVLTRITKFWAVTDRCSRCVRRSRRQVVRTLTGCRGTYTVGKCSGSNKSIMKITYQKFVKKCKCLKRIVSKRRWFCRCGSAFTRRVCRNTRFEIIKTHFILRRGRCVQRIRRSVLRISCARRSRRWRSCNRKSCKAFANFSYYSVRNCKCKKYSKSRLLGKCCCPKGYKRVLRTNRYFKKLVIVKYKLDNYKCRRIRRVRKIRISCPRGGSSVKCDASRGMKIFVSWKFVLTGNSCVRRYVRRRSAVKCRRPIKRIAYKCNIRKGNVKYRKVKLIYFRRNRCSCRRLSRTVIEMCGCRVGKFVKNIACPRGCSSSSSKCSSRCRRYKIYYKFEARGKRCVQRVFRRLAFRCCCSRNRRLTRRCKNDRFIVEKTCVTLLKNGKCQRVCSTNSKKVQCRIGRNSFWRAHANKNLRYRVTKIYFRRNCRCRVREQRRVCKLRCRKPITKRFCDRVKRQKVSQFISWKLTSCNKCVRTVREKRQRVKCRTGVKRWRVCKKNGILLLHSIKFSQRGCKCYRKKRTVSRRCKCRNPVIGAARCISNVWVRKVKSWHLRNGRCVMRITSRRKNIRCPSNRRYRRVCNRKTGVEVKFVGILRPKRCKCLRVWKKVSTRRCNCSVYNQRVASRVRRFCRNNRRVTVRYYYVLRTGRCILRTRQSSRGIRCRKSFTQRRKCNLAKKKQLYVKHTFVKKNCRCKLVKRNIWKPCGCTGRIVTRSHKCKPALGHIVTVTVTKKWSHSRNLCIAVRSVRTRRVACKRKNTYRSSKCIKNKYYVLRKIYFVRKGCKCYRKVQRRRFNCHCRNIIKKYKCKKTSYFRREVIQLRKWNMSKRKCVTVRFVTRKIRCRCPKGFVRKYCSNGVNIKKIVRIVLAGVSCKRNVIVRKYPVLCKGRNRMRYTKCNKCSRYKIKLAPRLNKKTCRCYYAVVNRQRCTCCCPRRKMQRRCEGDTHIAVKYTNYAAYTGRKCSLKCRTWYSRSRRRVPCRRRRRFRWLQCNRRSCVSKQQVMEYRLSKCRCVLQRRLTGRKRTCCCRANRRTKRVCLNSSIFAKISFTKFVPWRCVRRTQMKLIRRWACKGRVGTVIGKCNRRSCKQSVQDKLSIVDKPYCRCRTHLRNLRYRRCCCNRKPIRRVKCVGSCLKRTRILFGFNKKRRVCVQRIKRSVSCIKCGRNRRIVSRCNRRTCRKKITKKFYIVKNCKCLARSTYSYAVCCCQRPRVIGPVCISRGRWMWRKISWKLRDGRCVKKVTRRYRSIRCRSGVQKTRILRCNRTTCKQRVLRLFLHLRSCKCLKSWRPSTRLCCCRPAVRRWTRCENQRQFVKYTVTQTLHQWRRCIVKKSRRVLRTLSRCKNLVRVGACNRRTKKRVISISIRKAKNCKCATVRVVKKLVLCRCPAARVIRSKCSRSSCHRTVTKIWFSSTRKGHGVSCRRHNRIVKLRCCCIRRQTQRRFCDERTGAIRLRVQWYKFVLASRSCARQQAVRLIRNLRCKRTTCRIGKCSRKSGYKEKVCVGFKPDRSACSCRKYVNRRRIVCSCKPQSVVKKCVRNRKEVTEIIRWKINRRLNRCVRVRRVVAREVRCRRRRRIEKRCGKKCGGIKILSYYQVKNCKCIKRSRKWRIACCCPRQRCNTRCQGNRFVTKCVRYVLRNDRCVRMVRQRARVVVCKRSRVSRSKCRKCKFDKIIRKFAVRGCKCVQVRRKVRSLRCCCPNTRRIRTCRNNAHIVKTISYKLKQYRCLRKVHQRRYAVQCRRASVRVLGCNPRSRKRKIVTKKYLLKGCKCIMRRRVRYETCKCRPAYVVREKCAGQLKRKILKITFQLVRTKGRSPFCRKIQRLVRIEPCRCSKERRRTRCIGGSKWKTLVTKYYLVNRNSRNFCIARTKSYERIVRCKRRTASWSKCSGFRKTRTVVYYKAVKCACKRFTTKRVYACNCSRKNSSRRLCDRKTGRIITLRKRFFARRGSNRCSFTIRRKIMKVVCKRNMITRILSRKCRVKKSFGFYSQLLQKWRVRVGCKCIQKSRKLIKLCRCRRRSFSRRCVSGRIRRKISIQYVRKGNRCRRVRRVSNVAVRCRSTRPIIQFGGCNTRICKRSASITQCFVRSCRTAVYRKSAMQRCCSPKPKSRTYCDKKRGQFVTVVIKYKLVASKPLLKDRNGNVRVRQRRVVSRKFESRRNIRCPRNQRRETCSRSGIWKKILIVHRRVGCQCKRRRIVRSGRCKCPPARSSFGKCVNRYKTKKTIVFKLVAKKCLRFVRTRKYLCACLPNRSFTICDRRGNWKSCKVTYKLQFRRQKCVKTVRCRRRRQTCGGVSVRRSRCTKFKQKLIITRWRLNKRKCKCMKHVSRRTVGCNCSRWRFTRVLCVNGSFVTKHVSHYMRNHRCVRKVRKVVKLVRCNTRRRSSVISGSCVTRRGSSKRGLQKLRIYWQVKSKCKCIAKQIIRYVPCKCSLIRKYRTRRSRSCVRGSVRVMKILYFVLKGLTCVRRTRYIRRPVRCSGSRVVTSKCKLNSKGDSYKILKTYKRLSNGKCGCKWHVARVRFRICSCRKTVLRSLCLRDRIRRKEILKYRPVAGKSVCRKVLQRRDQAIRCRSSYWRRSKCRKCVYIKHLFAYKPKKCTCRKYRVRSVKLRCCCAKARTVRKCDARRNIITWKTLTYKLRSGRCIRRISVRSLRVRCKRKLPIYKFAKCIKGLRTLRRITFHENKCRCIKKVSRHRQRCSCPRGLQLRRGKCGKWFATDLLMRWKLKKLSATIAGTSKPKHKCVRVVASKRRRRCRCPRPIVNRRCLIDRIRTTRVTFHLRGNSCVRRKTVSEKKIGCSRRVKLVRRREMRKSCSRKYKYVQVVKYYFLQARACKCARFTRTKRYVCNCFLRFGGKRAVSKCVKNALKVTKKSWYRNVNKKCVKRVRVHKRAIKCKGTRVVKGKCNKNRLRTFTVMHRVAKKCRCVWRVMRRVSAACSCRPATRVVRCRGNAFVKQIRRWSLVGSGIQARCRMVSRNIVNKVVCKTGKFTKRTRCNAKGEHKIIHITRKIRNCRCIQQVRRTRCRCRCPSSSSKTVCSRNRFVTITKVWKLKQCRCFGDRTVRRRPVRCPRRKRSVSSCRRRGSGDKYKTLKVVYYKLIKCKCVKKMISRHALCGCDSRPRRVVSCSRGNIQTISVSKRKLVRGRCRRVVVSRRNVRINCGRMRTKKTCNKKTGVFSIFVVKPFVSACKCKNTVYRFKRRCRCYEGTKLRSKGKCNRSSCRRRVLLKRKVLKNMKCVWKFFHRTEICCCRAGRVSRSCLQNRGMWRVKQIKFNLRSGRCIRSVRNSYKAVKCSRKVSVRRKKMKNGILKIIRCKVARSGCTCRQRCTTNLLRYKCYKTRMVKKCECSKHRCNRVTYITYWKAISGKCYRKSRKVTKQLQCAAAVTNSSKCTNKGRYGWYAIYRRTQWKMHKCRCVKSTREWRVVCRCMRGGISYRCDSRQGLRIKTTVKYRISSSKRSCKRIVRVSKQRVRCDSRWRMVRTYRKDNRAIRKYRRFVRRGCRCIAQFRRRSCIIRCPRCRKLNHCDGKKRIVRVSVCWKIRSCACKKVRRVSYKNVRCNKDKVIRRCNKRSCVQTIQYIRYSAKNCKCIRSVRVVKNRCCCPRPRQQRRCIGGSIRIRTQSYHLVSGQCRVRTADKFKKIRCPTYRRIALFGKCINGKRKYSIHYWARKGCRCVRKSRVIVRPCVCAKKAIRLIFAVDLYDKSVSGYKYAVKKFFNKVTHPFFKQMVVTETTFLTYGSEVRVSKNMKLSGFSQLTKIADHLFVKKRTALAPALRTVRKLIKKSYNKNVQPIVVVISSGKHRNRAEILMQAKKLRKFASVVVVKIGKNSADSKYLPLVASKPRSHNYMQVNIKDILQHKMHKFPATELFERVCKQACRRSILRRSRCYRSSCKRVYTRITYKRDSRNRCIRKVRSWRRHCCCRRKGGVRFVCHRNRKLRIKVSYVFNSRRELCTKRVQKADVTGPLLRQCRPRVKLYRGKCKGTWRHDVYEQRKFVNCRCRVSRSRRRIRCGCKRSSVHRSCRKGRKVVRCVTKFILQNGNCVRRRSCSAAAVTCRKPWKSVSKCSSCVRKISRVTYVRRNCQCYRKVSVLRRRCCCSKKVQKYRFCDKKKNRHVTVTRWQKLLNGSCKKMTKRTYRTVKCRTSRQIRGKCRRVGSHFYRKVTSLNWTRKNCLCVKRRRVQVKLCRCRPGRVVRSCIGGQIVRTKYWWQLVGGRCNPRKRIVSRRVVTCSSKKRRSYGSCSISKNGMKFRKVTTKSQRRVGCKCVAQINTAIKLCRCRQSRRRIRCVRGDMRIVTVYKYRLHSGRCILYRKQHRQRVVCKFAQTQASKCKNGRKAVKVTVSTPVACKCKQRIYRKTISCKSGCRDLLPNKVCKKWASSKLRLCDRYPHYARKYCSHTCGLCYGCLTTTMVYSGRVCLQNQKAFRPDYAIGNAKTLKSCLRSCHSNNKCRAFSFKWHSRKCILFRVTRRDLIARSPRHGLRRGGRCLLFEKVCPKKCPYRRFVKQYRCRCKMIAKRKVCYRVLKVATFVRDRSGKCRRRLKNMQAPCRICEDRTYTKWCVKHKASCKRPEVLHMCPLTCGTCKRKPLVLTQKGKCKSGKKLVVRVQKFFDKRNSMWRVRYWRATVPCVRCATGAYSIIGECIKGKRKVTRVVARKVGGKCKVITRTKLFACSGCAFSLRRVIGRCSRHAGHWRRKVVTFFTIRKRNRCVVLRDIRIFNCSPKCPKDIVNTSRCHCGKQIRCVKYFVTFPGSRICVPKTHSYTRICAQGVCRNHMRMVDCLLVKRKGMCRNNKMRHLCARTCGVCK